MRCYNCNNRKTIPGDAHISCVNPPRMEMEIGSGGEERYEIAMKQSTENNAVVRCIWPGSGIFPICFDANTIFGCCNHNPDPV